MIRVTSYNILANSYATKGRYPKTSPEVLHWTHRSPAIASRIDELHPDVACLQEVEAVHWEALRASLVPLGWDGIFAQKGASRVDGSAILFRTGVVSLLQSEALYFNDGEKPSGHLALVGRFKTAIGLISIITTHLRWQADTDDIGSHIGYRQASELLAHLSATEQTSGAVICGDFNSPPEHPVVQLFLARGFCDAYAGSPQVTCVPNQRTARIDFIFVSDTLVAVAEPIPTVREDTRMPNRDQPSDHLPITARIARQH